jgi:hypothetical protein
MSAEWVGAIGQMVGALATIGALAVAFFVLQREQWDRRREAVRQVRCRMLSEDFEGTPGARISDPRLFFENDTTNAIHGLQTAVQCRDFDSHHHSLTKRTLYPGEHQTHHVLDHDEPPLSRDEYLSIEWQAVFSDYRGYRWACDTSGQVWPVRQRPHWPPWLPLHPLDRTFLSVRNPVFRRLDDSELGKWAWGIRRSVAGRREARAASRRQRGREKIEARLDRVRSSRPTGSTNAPEA